MLRGTTWSWRKAVEGSRSAPRSCARRVSEWRGTPGRRVRTRFRRTQPRPKGIRAMRPCPGPGARPGDVALRQTGADSPVEQILRRPAVDALGTPDAEKSADDRGHVHRSKTIAPGASPHARPPGVEDPLHLGLLGRIAVHAPDRFLFAATVREVRPGRSDGH